MAGAVVKVQTPGPQGLPGGIVQHRARAPGGENRIGQGQVPLEDGGVAHLLLVGQFPQGIGPGAVGGAGVIVPPGVCQEEALGGDGPVTGRGGGIVDHGAVVPGGQDGVKAGLAVVGISPAEGLQLIRCGQFGEAWGAGLGFHPIHEPGQGDAVGQVGLAEVGLLRRVLDGPAEFRGVGAVPQGHPGGNAGEQGGAHSPGVQHHRLALGQAAGIVIDSLIGPQGHPVGLQRRQHLWGKGRPLGKEKAPLLGEGQIGQHHGGARNVPPSQVQEPADVLQGGEEEDLRPLGGQVPPDLPELLLPGQAGVGLLQQPGRLGGEGRAVRPDLPHQVPFVVHLGPQLLGQLVVPPARPGIHAPAVKPQGLAGLKAGPEEPLDGGHPGLAHFHQADAGPLELGLCLEEVAPIGPQPRPVGKDQQGARGAGEAGDIPPAGEVVPHILAAVKVGGGDEIGVYMVLGHPIPEGLKWICHGTISFSVVSILEQRSEKRVNFF